MLREAAGGRRAASAECCCTRLPAALLRIQVMIEEMQATIFIRRAHKVAAHYIAARIIGPYAEAVLVIGESRPFVYFAVLRVFE